MRLGRVLPGLGCVLFALPVVATVHAGGVPPSLRLLAAAMLVATIARPGWGLLGVAFLLPLTPYLSAVLAPGVRGIAG